MDEKISTKIIPGFAWALDYIFKTIQYGRPLCATICPYARDLGLPVFNMLCSSNMTSDQEIDIKSHL